MSLILYFSPLSAPSRSVRTLLLLSKAPFQEKTVDLMKGEHKAPEFQRINPNESLPAIVDGNVKLFESHAILKYIAIRRTMDQYYPKVSCSLILEYTKQSKSGLLLGLEFNRYGTCSFIRNLVFLASYAKKYACSW
jgi:hypothetical protein